MFIMAGIIVLSSMTIASTPSMGDVPPSKKHEIDHLLNFVRDSECVIERNGKRHSSTEALAHIMKKYDYFRDRITTTEDFIRLSASKSTMSGRFYTVSCDGGETIRTMDWLMKELLKYRRKK